MPSEVLSLLDKAAKVCGSYSALAHRIGMSQPDIPAMRSGRRPISPETVAALCDVLGIAGDEARRLAAIAVIDAPKNRHKAQALRRVFFACWALGVVAAPQADAAPTGHQQPTMYRSSNRRTARTARRPPLACATRPHSGLTPGPLRGGLRPVSGRARGGLIPTSRAEHGARGTPRFGWGPRPQAPGGLRPPRFAGSPPNPA